MNSSQQDTAGGSAASKGVAISEEVAQGATQRAVQEETTPEGGAATKPPVNSGAATGADKTDRNWAVAAHLSGLSLYLGIPFGNILGPLVVWLIKKDESPYAEQQAKEALNFQISLTIYGIVAALLAFVFIGFLLIPVLFVLQIVLTIVATVRVSEGKAYEYPLTIRLIS